MHSSRGCKQAIDNYHFTSSVRKHNCAKHAPHHSCHPQSRSSVEGRENCKPLLSGGVIQDRFHLNLGIQLSPYSGTTCLVCIKFQIVFHHLAPLFRLGSAQWYWLVPSDYRVWNSRVRSYWCIDPILKFWVTNPGSSV